MTKTIKIIVILSCVLVAVVAALWGHDVISDRRYELEIMKPITLLRNAPQDYPKENRDVGKIEKGEKVKVLRMGYGKDFRAWKVRGSTCQEGWFIEEHDNIKIKN